MPSRRSCSGLLPPQLRAARKVTIPENVAIANVDDSCNIREGAGTNYNIIGIFPRNAYCIVLDEKDGWAHIKSGNVTGYIKTDYLLRQSGQF